MAFISKAEPQHVKQIYEIEKTCFSDPWSEESFKNALENENYSFYVLCENECVIGYGGILSVLDEGDVVNIAVHPNYRRNGYGKILLSALIDEAKKRELNFLHLEVRKSNTAALSLYNSFGFTYDCIRKGYYSCPKEDAVLMTLNLTDKK